MHPGEPSSLGSNPISFTQWLCDLGRNVFISLGLGSSQVKWEGDRTSLDCCEGNMHHMSKFSEQRAAQS